MSNNNLRHFNIWFLFFEIKIYIKIFYWILKYPINIYLKVKRMDFYIHPLSVVRESVNEHTHDHRHRFLHEKKLKEWLFVNLSFFFSNELQRCDSVIDVFDQSSSFVYSVFKCFFSSGHNQDRLSNVFVVSLNHCLHYTTQYLFCPLQKSRSFSSSDYFYIGFFVEQKLRY